MIEVTAAAMISLTLKEYWAHRPWRPNVNTDALGIAGVLGSGEFAVDSAVGVGAGDLAIDCVLPIAGGDDNVVGGGGGQSDVGSGVFGVQLRLGRGCGAALCVGRLCVMYAMRCTQMKLVPRTLTNNS